jgi:glycosyltransferase involved in cell wall biosynthesis
MSNLRVLLISSNSSARGGGERYLVFLAKGLKNQGLDVHVLLSDLDYMDGWARDFLNENVVVHRAQLKSLAQRPLRFVQALMDGKQINNIAILSRRIAPNAILVNQQYDEDGLDYVRGALKSGVGYVAGVIHMPMTETKNMRPLGYLRGQILRSWYRKNSYKKIFVSEGAKQEFNDYYKLNGMGYVINNSIPMEASENLVEKARIFPLGSVVIGFIGQFVAQKNLGCIISIWKTARAMGIDARLLLVGDGPELKSLEKILSACQSETWHITGWTHNPEAFLQEIDVFVLASHFEGLPLSLVEAAGRGVFSICAPFNGASDVAKHAPWVRIAKDNSTVSMAHLLCETLQSLDYLRSTPTEKCLTEFKNYFSLSRMVKEVRDILELYEEVN